MLNGFMHHEAFWLSLIFVLASLVTVRLVPQERRYLRIALVFFCFYLLSLSLAAVLFWSGIASGAGTIMQFGKLFCEISFIGLCTLILFDILLPTIHLGLPRIIRDIVVLVAYTIAILSFLTSLGVNLTSIIATSAIVTAVIGLSLQDTLGNIMAGLALQLESVIQVGDWVKVDQHNGKVKEIRWRQTTIETRNWDTVIIPNSQVMKSQVIVFGRREGSPLQTRRWVYFNVDFRFPPSDVIDCINQALQSAPIENVAAEPLPHTLLTDFKESYCQYAVRYWATNLAVDDPTDAVVRIRIYYALKRANISLSIPAHSVFMTEETKKRRERKEEQEIEHRVEVLGRIELFRTLTETELRELSGHLRYAPFSRSEVLTRQGAEAHWLYIIISGRVTLRVMVKNPTDTGSLEREVAQLGAGAVFGEMSLMTGEPRAATVIALEDVECYRLDKEAFQGIMVARPEIAEHFSQILAKRRVELDAVREGLDKEAHQNRMGETQNHILGLIREFFGI